MPVERPRHTNAKVQYGEYVSDQYLSLVGAGNVIRLSPSGILKFSRSRSSILAWSVYGCRLATAFGAKESIDLTRLYLEAQVIDGDGLRISLGEVAGFNHVRRAPVERD